MLDDHILYEEMYLPGYRWRAFGRWLRFLFYSFIWFVLAASILYSFLVGNYKKEMVVMQIALAIVGILFIWGLVHTLIVQIRYLRELLTPLYRVYRRNLTRVELLSKDNARASWLFGLFNVAERTSGYELHFNEPVSGTNYIGSHHLSRAEQKTWVRQSNTHNKPVLVVMGAYSGRIWDVLETE